MSRASKIFLGTSTVVSVGVIWGVHFMQKRESDTMYQGVLRDEARLREKALQLQSQSQSQSQSSSSSSSPSLSTGPKYNAPLNTPSSPVQQPSSILDPECETCHISPPPALLQAQSAEERKKEREARGREYIEQRGLGERLGREQGTGGRIV